MSKIRHADQIVRSTTKSEDTQFYRDLLWLQTILFLIAGLTMPFIGHRFGFEPDLNSIVSEIIHVMSDLGYPIFVFPFVVITIILVIMLLRHPKEKEISPQQFYGQLAGGFLAFLPYYIFGVRSLTSGNAPQGLWIFILYPLSSPVMMYFLYQAGYQLASLFAKAAEKPLQENLMKKL